MVPLLTAVIETQTAESEVAILPSQQKELNTQESNVQVNGKDVLL